MENEERFTVMEHKIDQIYASVEKTRLYFKWTLIISVVAIALPFLSALLILPFLTSFIEQLVGL